MFEKLKWVYKFFRSRTYVVILDRESAMNIKLLKPELFEDGFLLSAQTASLMEFKRRLEEAIDEHKDAIRLLSHRQGVNKTAKRQSRSKSANKTRVRKTATAKK